MLIFCTTHEPVACTQTVQNLAAMLPALKKTKRWIKLLQSKPCFIITGESHFFLLIRPLMASDLWSLQDLWHPCAAHLGGERDFAVRALMLWKDVLGFDTFKYFFFTEPFMSLMFPEFPFESMFHLFLPLLTPVYTGVCSIWKAHFTENCPINKVILMTTELIFYCKMGGLCL